MAQPHDPPDPLAGCAPHQVMESARVRAELTVEDLWWRYVALGGIGDVFDLDAHLHGISTLGSPEHDVLAHALNEALAEAHPARLLTLPATDARVEDALRRHLDDPTGCRVEDTPPGPTPVEPERGPRHGRQ